MSHYAVAVFLNSFGIRKNISLSDMQTPKNMRLGFLDLHSMLRFCQPASG